MKLTNDLMVYHLSSIDILSNCKTSKIRRQFSATFNFFWGQHFFFGKMSVEAIDFYEVHLLWHFLAPATWLIMSKSISSFSFSVQHKSDDFRWKIIVLSTIIKIDLVTAKNL